MSTPVFIGCESLSLCSAFVLAEEQSPVGKGGGEELKPVHGFCTQAVIGQHNSLLHFLNFLAEFLKVKTKTCFP